MLNTGRAQRRTRALVVGLAIALLLQLMRLVVYPTGSAMDGPLEIAPIMFPVSATITGLALRELDIPSGAILLLGALAGLMLTSSVAALLLG